MGLGGHWCFLVLFGVSCLGSCLSSSKSFSAKHFAGHPNPSQTYFIIGEKFEIDPSPARRWVMYGFSTKTMISPVGGSNSSSDPTSTQARPTPTQLRPKSDPSPIRADLCSTHFPEDVALESVGGGFFVLILTRLQPIQRLQTPGNGLNEGRPGLDLG